MKKKIVVSMFVAMLSLTMAAHATSHNADALLEQVLLLRLVEEVGVSEWGMVEVLQGYSEYREMMDDLGARRADKRAALEAALAAEEGPATISSLTRELMDIDMNILRAVQNSVGEAGGVLGTSAVAQLYLLVSDLDGAKAQLLAELTGKPAAPAVCPLTAEACAVDAMATVELTEEFAIEHSLAYMQKIADKDLEGFMSVVADDFEHYQFRTKDELESFLDDAMFMGYLDNIEIKIDDVEVEIDGDTVTAYPVDILGSFGTVTLELVGELRDGKLMLVSMDAFGI